MRLKEWAYAILENGPATMDSQSSRLLLHHALSAHGFFAVLVGRSSHLLEKTMMEIKRKTERRKLSRLISHHSSWFFSLKASLQQWLFDSQMQYSSIQLLINNAGIFATSSRFTSEGYDQMMATEYLSAFSLTKLLSPLLRNSPVPSRIANVTSFTHPISMLVDPGVVETNIMREVPHSYPVWLSKF